ncbi:RidA family protein [Chelativorans sp. Marseille-P2723]|uniref:RidA family protein n=1 Tax=Chelativorans sp. Marseille-P2723 TaxID=2709133 RepID=UPI001570A422|nr:RidA family protein [Chelativorans sp. Marseille-P2723]
MKNTIEKRLLELGVELPEPGKAVANYVPCVETGNLLITSGQLPMKDGRLMAMGLLGRELGTEAGKLAAKWCAVNVLAQAQAALGDLERIRRIVKITVFVASTPDYIEQHVVANGASDFLVAALGDKGRHARSAVGTASLPMNAPVEIEAIIEID